jgi:hypothetical protein
MDDEGGWNSWDFMPQGGMGNFQCPPQKSPLRGEEIKAPTQAEQQKKFISSLYFPHEGDIEVVKKKRPGLHGRVRNWGILAAVSFNSAAIDLICNKIAPSNDSLNLLSRLRERAIAGNNPNPIAYENSDPIVVKTLWAQIARPLCCRPLVSVWDGNIPKSWAFASWPRQQELTSGPCTFSGREPTLSINCFKTLSLTLEQVNQMQTDGTEIDTVPTAARIGTDGSFLVLLAVNIAAKEHDHWIWQTYNWDTRSFERDGEDANPYRPLMDSPATQKLWWHYIMKTDLADGTNTYSPYLEAKVKTPPPNETNCATCHKQAAFYNSDLATEIFNCHSGGTCPPTGAPPTSTQFLDTDSLWTLGHANVSTDRKGLK